MHINDALCTKMEVNGGSSQGDQVHCLCSGSASEHAASRHGATSEVSVGIDCGVYKVGWHCACVDVARSERKRVMTLGAAGE